MKKWGKRECTQKGWDVVPLASVLADFSNSARRGVVRLFPLLVGKKKMLREIPEKVLSERGIMYKLQTTVFQDEVAQTRETSPLDLPLARLQIIQARETLGQQWLDRSMIGPALSQNEDGLWLLSIRRQGEYGKFDQPYIGGGVVIASAELGIVVVLVAYHGNVTYGSKRNKRVQKGQFYRFFRQADEGWSQVSWQQLDDELRQGILDQPRPEWARPPGKLKSEKKPPARMVEMIS